MADPDRTQRVLRDLHSWGLRLAIDDFGTGYSSLSRLKNMPVDVLKIDQEFVRNVDRDPRLAGMVRAMIQVGQSLDMIPLAEGIETEGEYIFLRANGCRLAQGFWFAHPMPPEEFGELVRRPGGLGSPEAITQISRDPSDQNPFGRVKLPGLVRPWKGDVAGALVTARQDIEVLYREHGNRLWWALVAFSGDREIASDAAAEAFAQALRRGSAVRDPLAWIWKAAFRIAAGELQERRRLVQAASDQSYEPPESAAEVTAALRKLPARQRATVVLHYYADRPIREIAAILGTSPSTVAVHLHRGRNRLRELLGDDDA